jgi:hypothetical protein
MGRWYEGPSLAEEETAREEEEPAELPARLPSEPIELGVPSSEMLGSAPPDSIALDTDLQAGEDPSPVDEPESVPADTTADP